MYRTAGMMLISGWLLCADQAAHAQTIYALSGSDLYTFDAEDAATVNYVGEISGIAPGQMLEGIDFRPLTGQLYALGYDRVMQTAQLYTIDMVTAMATPVHPTPVSLVLGPAGAERLEITFDFNPTVDRIRVMSNRDHNYRLHPVTGAVVFTDLSLAYAAADMNAGINPNIVTGAYTNSYVGSTSTVLYDIDATLRVLAKQDPPNNGTLNTLGMLNGGVHKSASPADLDIWYNSQTQMNEAWLAVNTNGGPDKLVSLDLATGMGTVISNTIGGLYVDDIACYIDRSFPALTGTLGYALNANNFLLSFDAAQPAIIREAVPVTGITLNQSIVGMDFRPATGELYALGYNAGTGESQLYTINTMTGAATAINATPTILALGGTQVGVDFNPVVDKIRVVSANNMNYRLNTDGTLFFTDLALNYGAGDMNAGMDPQVGAAGYTNSFAGTATTSLYVVDNALNILALQSPPNDGVLGTIGATGIMQDLTDVTADLDIVYDGAMNWAYFTGNTSGFTFDDLYSVDLTTGMLTELGRIGNGMAIRNIAFPVYDPMRLAGAGLQGTGKLKVDVYPNPVHDLLNVKFYFTEATFADVRVFDLLGNDTGIGVAETVAAGGSVTLDVSPLVPGSYFVRVQAGGKTTSRSIIRF